MWKEDGFKEMKEIKVTLPAHGSAVYEIR
jgi:hypothetical protein